jgi:hypothetical protein
VIRLRFAVPAAALTLVGAAVAVPGSPTSGPTAFHAGAPPVGHTGGFGEPTCLECHLGSDLNAFGGRVSVLGLPDAYSHGERYVLTVRLEAEETVTAGFQLSARYGGGTEWGTPGGELVPVDSRVTVTRAETGQPYAHQTLEGAATADPDLATWSLKWVAPLRGGPVAIHVAANSANGDESPLNDLVYSMDVTIPPVRH